MRVIEGNASCADCNWHTYGKNSMGNAGKHNNKTGHGVVVEMTYEHCYPRKKIKKRG